MFNQSGLYGTGIGIYTIQDIFLLKSSLLSKQFECLTSLTPVINNYIKYFIISMVITYCILII